MSNEPKPEIVTPPKLRFKDGIFNNDPLSILRNGYADAIRFNAPNEILEELEDKIQIEKERVVKCQSQSQSQSQE